MSESAHIYVINPVYREVMDERARQDARWGEQNHLDGTGSVLAQIRADVARELTDKAAEKGVLTWALVLDEENAEVGASTDEQELRAELI